MKAVLIVEDDNDIREGIEQLLRAPDVEITSAKNGLEALDILQGGTPHVDLIILDLMMPRYSGWELLVEIRSHAALARIPVIIVSALAAPPKDLGAQAYLQKPFDPDRLTSAVERLLGLHHPLHEEHETPEPISGASWKSNRPDQTNVLIVDDEAAICDAIAGLLREYDFGIAVARDGFDALAVLRSGAKRIDLIVLDLMMPNCSGQELLAQLRSQPAFRHLPVLVVSARAGAPLRDLDIQGYMQKPFDATALIETVERLTNHSITAA